MAEEKQKSLDLALKNIEKNFGKGSVMRLGEKAEFGVIDVISTSSISWIWHWESVGPAWKNYRDIRPNLRGKQRCLCISQRRHRKTCGIAGHLSMRNMHWTHLCKSARRGYQWIDCLSTRYRRTGARNCRSSCQEFCCWCRRGRFRSGFGAARGNWRRDGRRTCRITGETDVAGFAKIGRCNQ